MSINFQLGWNNAPNNVGNVPEDDMRRITIEMAENIAPPADGVGANELQRLRSAILADPGIGVATVIKGLHMLSVWQQHRYYHYTIQAVGLRYHLYLRSRVQGVPERLEDIDMLVRIVSSRQGALGVVTYWDIPYLG